MKDVVDDGFANVGADGLDERSKGPSFDMTVAPEVNRSTILVVVRELARQLYAMRTCGKKIFVFFAPSRVKGETLSGGWSPHMDYPGGPSRHMIVFIMQSVMVEIFFVTN